MDTADRTHEASPHRLQKAYAEGRGPATPELVLVAALSLAAGTVSLVESQLPRVFARWGRALWSPDTFATLAEGDFSLPTPPDLMGIGGAFWPLLLLPVVVTVFVVAQKGLIWNPALMTPDPSRLLPRMPINDATEPIETLLRSGGRLTLAALAMVRLGAELMPHGLSGPVLLPAEPLDLLRRILGELAVLALLLAVADFLWRRMRFLASLRMTAAEVKLENRSLEGDPRVRGERNRRMEAMFDQGASSHPNAGPARRVLLWSGDQAALIGVWADPSHVPVLYARGSGADAARMCQRGRAAGLPVHWLESLEGLDTGRPGRPLPASLFSGVAAVHRHVFARMRAGGRS